MCSWFPVLPEELLARWVRGGMPELQAAKDGCLAFCSFLPRNLRFPCTQTLHPNLLPPPGEGQGHWSCLCTTGRRY